MLSKLVALAVASLMAAGCAGPAAVTPTASLASSPGAAQPESSASPSLANSPGSGVASILPLPTGEEAVGVLDLGDLATGFGLRAWYPAVAGTGTPNAAYMSDARWAAFGMARQPPAGGFSVESLARLRTTASTDATPAPTTVGRPVVLLLPGWTMPAATLTVLAVDLASHGYVAVQIDPPPGSEPVDPVDRDAAQRILAVSRLAAVDDALAALADPAIAAKVGMLEVGRVVVAGHSLGGDVSFAAGSRPGVVAVVLIDAGIGSLPDEKPLDVPVLMIAAELTELWTDPQTTRSLRDSATAVSVGLRGAAHCDMVDLPVLVEATGAGTSTAPGGSGCYGPLGVAAPVAVATVARRFLDGALGAAHEPPRSADLIQDVPSGYVDPFGLGR